MYTEFISSEGLIRNAWKSTEKLSFSEFERPIGIQIFGNNITSMEKAAALAEESNPDIIDINYGCSVKKVESKGAGAGALKDIPKMIKMTEAVVKSTKLPVTVKTRLGYDDKNKNIVEIAEQLQDVGIKAIAIHGRTRTMKWNQPADWRLIGEVKNNPRMIIPVIGNGDITDPQTALEKKNKYGVDGIMIGREAIGNPWIFREIKHYFKTGELMPKPSVEEIVETCRDHFKRSIEWKGERVAILEMRKHYSKYFRGFPDFKKYKVRLVSEETSEKINQVLNEIIEAYG